jgi:hypothetical protein
LAGPFSFEAIAHLEAQAINAATPTHFICPYKTSSAPIPFRKLALLLRKTLTNQKNENPPNKHNQHKSKKTAPPVLMAKPFIQVFMIALGIHEHEL